jgi:SAM-dependent methyltransferase
MFSRGLKKQQKLALLLAQTGDLKSERCLLITNGDNNGALNWHFRSFGGNWTWVENEEEHIEEMQGLLGEEVLRGSPSYIPAENACFDVVVSVDVHEHLEDCSAFNSELTRITRPGGRVIVTTPNGGQWRPVNLIKAALGMTPRVYGHAVVGYTIPEHRAMLSRAGLQPIASGSYSHFFTELIELAINFVFVKILLRRRKGEKNSGQIAPTSQQQLAAFERQYRLYSRVYPLLRFVSSFDLLCSPLQGYAVSVVCQKSA